MSANVVKSISNINGLSNNSVNCIFEDSQHVLWIGTWDGLNYYNGREIISFRYNKSDEHSISNNVVRQVLEQNEDNIWIATDYGINKWNRKSQLFTRFLLGTENRVPRQEKSFLLAKSSEGNILCLVKGEGLFFYKKETDSFEKINLDFVDYIKDFKIDSNDKIYFLFQDGDVCYYNISELYDNIKVSALSKISLETKTSQIIDTDEFLLSINKNKISLINRDIKIDRTIVIDNEKTVSSVVKDDSLLYISFYEGGCILYNLENNTYKAIGEIANHISIFTLFKGSQDILWVGSDGQGVLQFYKYNFPFQTAHTEHPVRTFAEDGYGNILIGTKGGGIKKFNQITQSTTDHLNTDSGLLSNSVYSLYRNKSNDVFVGTEGEGINIIYAKTNTIEKLHIANDFSRFKAIYSIHTTHNDSLLWVGTSGYGLIKIELKKKDGKYVAKKLDQYTTGTRFSSLSNDVVYAIASNRDKELWFGTRGGGLNILDIESNTIKRLDELEGSPLLTNNDILSIRTDNQNLWVGTSYGLNKLTKQNDKINATHFLENEGLINNTIHGILQDKSNRVWVSTNQGISLIEEGNKIKNYTINDGLQNDEFSDGAYFIDQNMMLYFGGVSGFNYFTPENIKQREFNAPLVLNNIKIYNTSQSIYDRIKNNSLDLSYEERYITLSFLAKDFINNENCEYAYRLINNSDEWILLGNNSNIVFTKLPPGKYILEVKNTNGDKQWNNEIYRLAIKVGPPWWLSVPAIIVYLLLIMVAIYLTQSIVKNRIKLSRELLIEKIEKQQQFRMHEEKLDFFTNVAHEFFTPLTLIYGPSQHLLEKGTVDSYTRKYLHIIKNNAERMQKLISELMEFRKVKSGHTPLHPELIDINLLLSYISDNYINILHENKIEYKVNSQNISSLYTDRNALEKIFFNLVSNAFKYTPSNGYIHINIGQDDSTDNTLSLTIRNSGKGLTSIQMEEIFDKHKIFDTPKIEGSISSGVGLNLTKSLTEVLGGNISVSSVLGEFVEFTVTIPPLSPNSVNIVENNNANETHIREVSITEKNNKCINILIVEDEKNIRELLKDILSPTYTIIEATNGIEALSIIEKNHPDIIISDILMPQMDGISLIDNLKSNNKTRYIPIISISAKATTEDHITAYKHGADIYITKPFHPKHIESAVHNLISKQEFLKEYFHSTISSIKVKDGIDIHEQDEILVHEIMEYVKKNIEDDSLDPNAIAEFMGVSKATLYRKLKEITGDTPSEFIRKIRLDFSSKLLRSTQFTVSEIIFKSGFSNKSYFYREFMKTYGVSPGEYRKLG